MRDPLHRFAPISIVDTEYVARPGEPIDPVCLVVRDFRSKYQAKFWYNELGASSPYPTGPDSLVVAYMAAAEVGVHLKLGWRKPERILDLYVEYRNRFNCLPTIVEQKIYVKGEKKIKRNSLIGALTQFGLDTIGVAEKDEMTDLINTGGPWTPDEKLAILNYCESDVDGTDRLLTAMLPQIDVPRAIYRGRYMAAEASMEAVGVPTDIELLSRLRDRWEYIERELIARVDAQYGVYEGASFREDRFERWLAEHEIFWPRYPSGHLVLKDEVFRDMAKVHPVLNPLRELRSSLSKMRLNGLRIGADGFNRCGYFPFGASSSRHTPSSSQSIYGSSTWVRGLIKPPPDFGLAQIDWRSQEFGVAAALSGDPAMMMAYKTGDVYLEFGKLAGAIPTEGTLKTHKLERDLYKQCVLGLGYGIGEHSLALRTGQHLLTARSMMQRHRETFWRFWEWSENRVRRAMLTNVAQTVFGWTYHVTASSNVRSIQNFPMQGNAAEVLRLAICLGVENGITVCAPIHDAVLILSPLDRLDSDIAQMRAYMERASEIVLNGFKLETEYVAVRYPDRYMDEARGRQFWDLVMSLL